MQPGLFPSGISFGDTAGALKIGGVCMDECKISVRNWLGKGTNTSGPQRVMASESAFCVDLDSTKPGCLDSRAVSAVPADQHTSAINGDSAYLAVVP